MKEFRKIKEHLRVLARSSPEDKYILVTGIQDCGGVVAVTGDGTNDAQLLPRLMLDSQWVSLVPMLQKVPPILFCLMTIFHQSLLL
jgi:hypothetical protein